MKTEKTGTDKRQTQSARTTRKLIDWDAYKQGMEQLANTPVAETMPNERGRSPTPLPADGIDLLAEQTDTAADTARIVAMGHLGKQLGATQGQGDAPVQEEPAEPVFTAMKHHADLQRQLGNRLAENYRQHFRLEGQNLANEARRDLQQLKGDQQLQRQQQHDVLLASTQTATNSQGSSSGDFNQQLVADKPAPKAATHRGLVQRGANAPFRITDTDGQTVRGHWYLTPDEAAQVVQTAMDLGDQAQLDYVARLVGAEQGTDRQETSARLMALQQKALMGNADARMRMTQLLSAIIPSLKGRKLIDGILNSRYQKITRK